MVEELRPEGDTVTQRLAQWEAITMVAAGTEGGHGLPQAQRSTCRSWGHGEPGRWEVELQKKHNCHQKNPGRANGKRYPGSSPPSSTPHLPQEPNPARSWASLRVRSMQPPQVNLPPHHRESRAEGGVAPISNLLFPSYSCPQTSHASLCPKCP